MMNRKILLLITVVTLTFELMAQNRVIIGERRDPKPDARLELVNPSGSQAGLLLPFVELEATNKPTLTAGGTTHAHLKGMTVYNTATVGTGETAVKPGIYYNDGTRWIMVGEVNSELLAKNFWSLTGNASTDPSKNFLGTTDDKDLVFKRSNIFAGYLKPSSTYLGVSSLPGSGGGNTIFGTNNLNSNTGVNSATNNTVLGNRNLGKVTTGSDNIAVGSWNLQALTTGTGNIAIGSSKAALIALTTGTCNTAIGAGTALALATGVHNIAIGSEAMDGRTDGNTNIAIGYRADTNRAADGNGNNIMLGTQTNPITLSAINKNLGQINIGTLIQGIGSGLYAEGSSNRKRVGVNLNNKNTTTTNGVFPTETFDVSGTMRIRTLPASGDTNSINTKSDGTTNLEKITPDQTFNATRTVVADANGVLGTVAGLPGGTDVWRTNGNSGTAPSTNFVGTTDNNDLIFKRNKIEAARISHNTEMAGTPAKSTTLNLSGNIKVGHMPKSDDTDMPVAYNPATGELTATPKADPHRPFYRISYTISTGDGDWVKDWDTKIDANKYTVLIVRADFCVSSGGHANSVPTIKTLEGGVVPQQVSSSQKDGTWRINCDFLGTNPSHQANLRYGWEVTLLVISNTMVSILPSIEGSASQSTGGGGVARTPIPN